MGGGNFAKADTSLLTAGNGWTKITELPTDVSLYYFTIVDNNQDLMLTLSRGLNNQQQEGYNGLFYATSANPLVDKSKLFSLEKDGDNYVMRNVEYNGYFLQTEYNAAYYYRTHDNGGGAKSWGHIKFTYANSVWTIQNAKYPVDNGNYLGMWEDASPANGKALALNKANDKKGTFQIYSILKTDVDAYYASLKIANAGVTPETPVDMTGLIVNPNARFWTGSIPFGWTTTGTQNVNKGNGYDQFPGIFEFSDWGAGSWTGSLKQTITVPNGKFRLKAAIMAATGVTAYLTANSDKSDNLVPIGDSGGNINPDGTETTMGNGQRGYKYLTVETIVTTGSLELGAYGEASAEHLWVNADNFTLSYLDPFISALATEITAASATSLTAGGWYKFTAASSDNYSFDASAVGDIIYTTDDQLNSVATGTAATAVVALTEGTTYYIKSSSAQTLTITPQTFTYVIGDGTPSVADDQYTQNKTFTLTFADCSTDDPDATFQILDASKITVNGAAATASLTDKVLTITLADPLAVSTNYAISVAAGAVGYKADAANDAITLTVHTPAVFDGHYYIKKDGEDLYFSRGGSENKQAVLDAFGVPLKITTDASNMSRIKFVDTGLLLGASGSSTMYWTDKGTGTPTQIDWTITKSGDDYKFYLMGMDDAKKGMNIDDDAPKSDTEANACTWELELPAAHPAKLQAVKDAQAATVATAMGFDGVTTQAQMNTYLETNYGETSIEITGTGGTNKEAWQQTAPIEDPFEYAIFAEETVNDLKPGLYRLRVYGFERIAGGQAVYDAGGAAGLAYVYATSNSVTEKVKLASLFDVQSDTPWKAGNDLEFGGKYYPNGQEGAQNAFNAGNYANDVYVKVVDEGSGTGSIKFGIKQPNAYYSSSSVHNNSQWICYNNFSLVRFDAKPTAEQKTALATAISEAEGKTLGFENGEYAPYNNVAAIEALAAAKAIDPEKATGAAVVAATSALTSATWTANVGKMNAVYWKTDYTVGDKTGDYVNPIGWTNVGYNTRIMNSALTADAAMTTIGTAIMSKYNTTYGEETGYTMPLKAGKIYKITFKYCGWGNNPTTNVVLTDPESNTITLAPGFKPATNDGNTNAEHWYDYTGYFVSTTAGNYVLAMNKVESGQQQIAWANMQIVSASELEFADGSVPTYAPGTYPTVKITRDLTAGNWATAVYPFAVSGVDGLTIANLDSYSDGTLRFETATAASTANVPFFMMSNTDKSEITLSNVAVAAASAENATSGDASLKGAYSTTNITNAEKNYVLSNNKIFSVGGAGATINPYRAYIQLSEGGGSARALSFVVDGKITGVDNVKAASETEVKDGKYLENGKIVIVKNGKKFNAAGAKLY